jgi:malate synthase
VDHASRALDDGRIVTRPLVEQLIAEEVVRIREEVGAARFDSGRFGEARTLFAEVATSNELQDFLTVPAYNILENTA